MFSLGALPNGQIPAVTGVGGQRRCPGAGGIRIRGTHLPRGGAKSDVGNLGRRGQRGARSGWDQASDVVGGAVLVVLLGRHQARLHPLPVQRHKVLLPQLGTGTRLATGQGARVPVGDGCGERAGAGAGAGMGEGDKEEGGTREVNRAHALQLFLKEKMDGNNITQKHLK